MNKKFPFLSLIAQILRLIGGVIVVLSGIVLLLAFIRPDFWRAPGGTLMGPGLAASSAIAGIIAGLFIAAMGEVIGVLFAIEENTRAPLPAEAPARVSAPVGLPEAVR